MDLLTLLYPNFRNCSLCHGRGELPEVKLPRVQYRCPQCEGSGLSEQAVLLLKGWKESA